MDANDPNDCRKEAFRLAKEAAKAQSPDHRATLWDRAGTAFRRAVRLEQQLLLSLSAIDREGARRARVAHLKLTLDDANRMLERAESLVAGWRELMSERQAKGDDVTSYRELLSTFEANLEARRTARNLLRQMLTDAKT